MFAKNIGCALLLILLYSCDPGSPNLKMVQMLSEKRDSNYSAENPFCPEAKLETLNNSLASISDDNKLTFANFQKANLLVQTGNESQAFELAQQLLLKTDPSNPIAMKHMLKTYAIAALRMGERQNCVSNHAAESCVMPIKGKGLHQNIQGSSKAIQAYQSLLQNNPEDLESRWLLNIAYMTLGKYPAEVPEKWLIPALDQENAEFPFKPFKDIARQLNVCSKNLAGGSIMDDFNSDGFLDLITSDWDLSGKMHYYRNNGKGGFEDISESSGLGLFTGGLNMVQADYNNDGHIDILVLRGAWMPGEFGKQPNSLLRNNGDGTFTDVTIESGLLSYHPTQTAVWRDFNNDGWLDLFIGNETSSMTDSHPCELYINKGNGEFEEVGSRAFCAVSAFVKGVTAADYNNDGLSDIFISTCDGRRILLKNKGIAGRVPQFEDVTAKSGLGNLDIRTFPTWFWDYDNDGWPDIFVCGYQPNNSMAYVVAAEALGVPEPTASKMYLYHNNHDGTFTEVSKEAGLEHSVFAMGSNFGDLNNDGYLDMYLGTGNPDFTSLLPNKLYMNMGGKKFADVTVAARVGNLQKGHGVAISDLDNDGDQDIFIETGGAFTGDHYYNSLYMNPGQNKNNWLYLNLVGTKSNRSAIGARIKLTFKENGMQREVYRDLNSGGSFGGSSLRREIGIGEATVIDEIVVRWAGSNEFQVFKNVIPNLNYEITEGKPELKKLQLHPINYDIEESLTISCAPLTDTRK